MKKQTKFKSKIKKHKNPLFVVNQNIVEPAENKFDFWFKKVKASSKIFSAGLFLPQVIEQLFNDIVKQMVSWVTDYTRLMVFQTFFDNLMKKVNGIFGQVFATAAR